MMLISGISERMLSHLLKCRTLGIGDGNKAKDSSFYSHFSLSRFNEPITHSGLIVGKLFKLRILPLALQNCLLDNNRKKNLVGLYRFDFFGLGALR